MVRVASSGVVGRISGKARWCCMMIMLEQKPSPEESGL
jgi:hypothetical protein